MGKQANVQYAALPYELGEDGAVRILLVTSRGTRRWIIPKGWPMKLHPPHKAAAVEAFEEAGVVGRPAKKAIGAYEYDKVANDGSSLRCRVTVFPLAVERLDAEWPEAGQRQRQWFAADEAAGLVDEPELRELLRHYRPPSPRRPGKR